ncbi:MAG: lactonase family protein [Methylophilaceae bacterium]
MKFANKTISILFTLFAYGASAGPLNLNQSPEDSTYLVGTYTDTKNQGIELLSFNTDNMTLSSKVIASGIKNPSFVIANRARSIIFAVESTLDGKISSFTFNDNQLNLALLNTVESFGDYPCYIALDKSENFLAVANYASGSFSIYEIDTQGNLHFKQSIEHVGSSISKLRQNTAHVHSMLFHPNGRQLLVADLGTDKIYIYDVDFSSPTPITPANPAYFKVAAGSGPRHMAIHPSGKILYVVHELTGEIGVYLYKNGEIKHANTQPLTSPTFKGHVQAAEVRISSDGKFVYVSNRGSANDISVFEVGLGAHLHLIQQISTGGKTPRNFTLSVDERFLLAANQDSDDIHVFKRDLLSGQLEITSTKIKINKPAYIFPLN